MDQKLINALVAMIQSGDQELADLAIERLKLRAVVDGFPPPKRKRMNGKWSESMREEATRLAAKGWSYRRIGKRLGITGNTVSSHLRKGSPTP
jgi:DNA-binding NarL/FixJ family response regulator